MTDERPRVEVRPTRRADFAAIEEMSRRVYPDEPPWERRWLSRHLETFPEGQLVAVAGGEVVGMASSLIVTWDDYDMETSWHDFTAGGTFANHDPSGRTLYGAEVMVDPARQRSGIGSALYVARRELVRRLGLRRIRAGARLRSYARHHERLAPEEYVAAVVEGRVHDPTLSFQLRHGFRVIAVVEDYLADDPHSLGWAAVIEWLNAETADGAGSADLLSG